MKLPDRVVDTALDGFILKVFVRMEIAVNRFLLPIVLVYFGAATELCYQGEYPDNAAYSRAMTDALGALDAIEVTGRVQNFDLREQSQGKIVGGLEPITFRTLMARDQLRCDVSTNGKLLASFAWFGSRFQEYRPHLPHRLLMEYDAPTSSGTDDTVLEAEYDCLVASQLASWLVPNADNQVSYWVRYIIEGRQLANELVEGRECAVFEWTRKDGDDIAVRHLVFIDAKTYLPVAWHTEMGISEVRRERYYHLKTIEKPCRADEWRIRVDSPPPPSTAEVVERLSETAADTRDQ